MEGGSGRIQIGPGILPCRVANSNIDFEGEGDWNRACCHSHIKMCTVWYISWGLRGGGVKKTKTFKKRYEG